MNIRENLDFLSPFLDVASVQPDLSQRRGAALRFESWQKEDHCAA
jgi:hypothetical protein